MRSSSWSGGPIGLFLLIFLALGVVEVVLADTDGVALGEVSFILGDDDDTSDVSNDDDSLVLAVHNGTDIESAVADDELDLTNVDHILRVDISEMEGFVMSNGSHFGFDIDMMNALAVDLGYVRAEFREVPFENIFDGVKNGGADIAAGGISITYARESSGIDFSHAYFDSGLGVAVRPDTRSVQAKIISNIFTWDMFKLFLKFLGMVVFFGNILWLTERGCDNINDNYFPGIFEACWLTLTTMTTVGYGDFAPGTWIGRGTALVIMAVGITFFCTFAADLATKMAEDMDTISSPYDLSGENVAVINGTTSVDATARLGAKLVRVNTAKEAYEKLDSGEVKAVVHDAPSIMYYIQHNSEISVRLTDIVFDEQDYGLAVNAGSDLRERVNCALLKLGENGASANMHARWFGSSGG